MHSEAPPRGERKGGGGGAGRGGCSGGVLRVVDECVNANGLCAATQPSGLKWDPLPVLAGCVSVRISGNVAAEFSLSSCFFLKSVL